MKRKRKISGNLILHLKELGKNKKKKQTKPTDEAVAIGAWLGWRGGKAPVDNVRRMRSIGGWVVTKGSGLTISHDVEE